MNLFVYKNKSAFVQNDIDILKARYNIKKYRYNSSKKFLRTLINQFKLLIWLISNFKHKNKKIFIWFAEYHSLLPTVLGKIYCTKTYLVIGGYDIANIPEWDYGALSKFSSSFYSKLSIKLAYICLPVSKYIKRKTLQEMGYVKTEVIYNGTNLKMLDDNFKKENIFLTAAKCNSEKRLKIKGMDIFIKLAHNLPNYRFIAIGIPKNIQKYLHPIPDNLIILEPIPLKKLVKYYKRSKFYCQLSRVEAFGIAVLESLCYHTIPIVSNQGALPELYSEVGLVVDIKDTKKMIDRIKSNIGSLSFSKNKASKLISKYNIKNRANKLYKVIGR
mgnify:CR=1 FL=1